MKSLSEVEKLVGLKRRAIQEYEDKGLAIKPTHKNKYGCESREHNTIHN